MNRSFAFLFLALSVAPLAMAQSSSTSSTPVSSTEPTASATPRIHSSKKQEETMKPFSRLGLGAGISFMGVNLQAATDIDRYLNLRVLGNVFGYSVNNISTNGFNANANVNMATAGLSVDYYPFPTHGLRLSPGVLFYNQNSFNATATAPGGTYFTLNNDFYFSSTHSPVQGTASVGFNAQNPAFTLTTGWGNLISRTGSHFSFPFEIGDAFVGSPAVNLVLQQGQVCDSSGANCIDVASDSAVQADLQTLIAKYKSDLSPLKVYPILSFGIGYSFHIR